MVKKTLVSLLILSCIISRNGFAFETGSIAAQYTATTEIQQVYCVFAQVFSAIADEARMPAPLANATQKEKTPDIPDAVTATSGNGYIAVIGLSLITKDVSSSSVHEFSKGCTTHYDGADGLSRYSSRWLWGGALPGAGAPQRISALPRGSLDASAFMIQINSRT